MEEEHPEKKKEEPSTQTEFMVEKEEQMPEDEIPDHFYDSDLASINEKDFLSDNEPPKDQIQERKLLYKEKMLHVHKTIIRLGTNIEKPAKFDRISLRYKQVPEDKIIPFPIKKDKQTQYIHPEYFKTFYLMNQPTTEYNLGKDYEQIQRLVTSMKRGQAAVFELEHLQINKKNNIKKRIKVDIFVIWVEDWTTVIDIDCDGKFMKQVVNKGEGHSRIGKYDQVCFDFKLSQGLNVILDLHHATHVKFQESVIESMPNILWKLLYYMKSKEKIRVPVQDQVMREVQGEKYDKLVMDLNNNNTESWMVEIEVHQFHSLDDIFMDGRLLKKTIIRGVSTAKPDSSSLCYFALQIYGLNGELLHQDQCWQSNWWEDLGKLDELGCRKNHLDDHSVSVMLKTAIKRMKPAQIAEIQCRDRTLFTCGNEYDLFKKLTGAEQIPEKVKLGVRLYNFSQGKNCFNMQLEEKVAEAKRKKPIAVQYLNDGDIPRALKTFEQIVSYFSADKINQEAYDEKVSALMNSTLCQMKNQNYRQMLTLCEQILEKPKHGYDPEKMKIKGPGHAKIQGKLPDQPDSEDEREHAGMVQNPKIVDKCLYRKAFALTKTGDGSLALDILSQISVKTEEVVALEKQAQKMKANYEKKSAKMFKNMFG